MQEALVEHAQHDVDHQHGGEDQQRHVAQRSLEGLGRAHEAAPQGGRQMDLLLGLVDGRHGIAQGHAHGQVEGQGHRGQLALMVHREGRVPAFQGGEGAEGDQVPGVGAHVGVAEAIRRLHEGGVHLHDHVVLVQTGVDGGHEALAEGVVQGVVDGLGRDAQAGGRGPVDDQGSLQPLVLEVRVDIRQLAEGLELVEHLGRPVEQLPGFVALQGVLVLGAGGPTPQTQVLDRLHVEGAARQVGGLAAQAGDDLVSGVLALVVGL